MPSGVVKRWHDAQILFARDASPIGGAERLHDAQNHRKEPRTITVEDVVSLFSDEPDGSGYSEYESYLEPTDGRPKPPQGQARLVKGSMARYLKRWPVTGYDISGPEMKARAEYGWDSVAADYFHHEAVVIMQERYEYRQAAKVEQRLLQAAGIAAYDEPDRTLLLPDGSGIDQQRTHSSVSTGQEGEEQPQVLCPGDNDTSRTSQELEDLRAQVQGAERVNEDAVR